MNGDDLYCEVTNVLNKVMRSLIDERFPVGHPHRKQAAIQCGKAAASVGAMLIGNALGIRDPGVGLAPLNEMLARFSAMKTESN